MWLRPSPTSALGVPAAGQACAWSNERVEAIAIPGAEMSGFMRLSRVGPMLENVARLPGSGVPVNVVLVPLQASQLCFEVHAATVINSTALPGWLTSSVLLSAPARKFAVVVLRKNRHRSTSQLAGPTTTGMNVNVQVPFALSPVTVLIST